MFKVFKKYSRLALKLFLAFFFIVVFSFSDFGYLVLIKINLGNLANDARINKAQAATIPTFQATAGYTGIGAVSVPWPTHLTNDVALLFIQTVGAEAATLSTPAGFVEVLNSPQATGTGTAGTRTTVFWARATSAAMATPTVADSGNHTTALIMTYRGVTTAGNPWDVTAGSIKATASTTLTFPTVTTTVADTLIVLLATRDLDSSAAWVGAVTNANLTTITERWDTGATGGVGGGITVTDGGKAIIGVVGTSTATITSSINAQMTIALRPEVPPDFSVATGDIVFSNGNPNLDNDITITATIHNNGGDWLENTGVLGERYDNSNGASQNANYQVYTGEYLAQSFTPTSNIVVSKASLYLLCWIPNPPAGSGGSNEACGTVTVKLETDSAGLPSNTVLATSSLVDVGNTPISFYDFSFTEYPSLTAGTKYWIVAEGSRSNTDAAYGWGSDNTSPTYTGGNLAANTGAGQPWTGYITIDAWFRVYGGSAAPILVKFYDGDPDVSGIQIGSTQVITTLSGGTASNVDVSWGAGAAGTHIIYAQVDRAAQITETNETNNKASKAITVNPVALAAPTTMYVGYPSAQTCCSNPIDIKSGTPMFSATNNHAEAVTIVQIQVTTSADTGYATPLWSSGDLTGMTSTASGARTPDIPYGVGSVPTNNLQGSQSYIWRMRTKGDFYSDWSANGTIAMASSGTFTDRFYEQDNDSFYGSAYTLGGRPDNDRMVYGGWGDFQYNFIKWNNITLGPPSADTVTANLYLYSDGVAANNPTERVNMITNAWTENSVSNASNPTTTATNEVFMTYPPLGWFATDITNMYKDWKNGAFTNHGIKITPTTTTSQANGKAFMASESSWYALDPYLEVSYTFTGPPSVTGNVYNLESTTPLIACDADGGTKELSLRASSTTYTASCSNVDGSFSFTNVTKPSAGAGMVVWIEALATDGALVIRYDGTGDSTGNVFYDDAVTVTSDDTSAVTNTNMDIYDNVNDTDIPYTVTGTALTVNNLMELHVTTGKTYTPGGNVTTDPSASASSTDGDLHIAGTGTLNMEANALSVGGDFNNEGTMTFTSGQTTTFTATATGHTITDGGENFENIIFNGASGGWSFADATTITKDLTLTAGTLSGTVDVTVNGAVAGTAGIINLTAGTFEQRVSASKNFGTTSGTTAWTFNNLTFSNSHASTGFTVTTQGGTGGITVSGILNIGKTGDAVGAATTLDAGAGNRTWTLSGTGGDPFQILASPAGNLTPGTSTFAYTGNNGASNTTVQSETYNVLQVNNASEIYALEGTTAGATVTITAGTLDTGANALSATGDLTVTGTLQGTGNVTINGNVTGAGTVTMTGGTFEQIITGANKNFGSSSGTNEWTFSGLKFNNSDGALARTITPNAGTGGTITISGTLTLGDSGTQNITFDNETSNDRVFNIDGSILISTKGVFSVSSSAAFTLATNMTNNGTFTANSGTVTVDGGGTSTFDGSGTPSITFFNLTSTTAGKTLSFTEAKTFRINGKLTISGASGNQIHIHSTSGVTQWLIDHQGTEDVTYAHIEDSGCAGGTTNISLNNTSTNGDSNNGNCWLFTPIIYAIDPVDGGNNAFVFIVSVTGANFVSGATMKLTKVGQADIICTGFAFPPSNSTTLSTGNCPITGALIGAWNVIVTNPDAQTSTLTGGFTIYFAVTGSLISSTFDTGYTSGVSFNSIMWRGNPGTGGSVKFQLGSSNCPNGATNPPDCLTGSWSDPSSYLGPNGTPNSFYSSTTDIGIGEPLPIVTAHHKNKRYYRYKVYLDFKEKIPGDTKPVVDEVIVNWGP